MKRLIIFLLLFAAIKVAGQTTGYLRFDTVMIHKVGGTAELVLMNKTKDTLGILTNYGNGRTRFIKSRAINDSTIVVGLDTLTIRGAGGITADNGLTKTGNNIALGGPLIGNTSISGTDLLTIDARAKLNNTSFRRSVTGNADYTITVNDFYIELETTTAQRTITFPSPAGDNTGRVLWIADRDESVNDWQITGSVTDINDPSSGRIAFVDSLKTYWLISDGTNWVVQNVYPESAVSGGSGDTTSVEAPIYVKTGAEDTIAIKIDPVGGLDTNPTDSAIRISSNGVANQVMYWTGTRTFAGDAGMVYDAPTDLLTFGNYKFGSNSDFSGINRARLYSGVETNRWRDSTRESRFIIRLPFDVSGIITPTFIQDSDHELIGYDSIKAVSSDIVTYRPTVSDVHSAWVQVDETLARLVGGFGPSVGLTSTTIRGYRHSTWGGAIYWNTTTRTWYSDGAVVNDNTPSAITYDSLTGILQMTVATWMTTGSERDYKKLAANMSQEGLKVTFMVQSSSNTLLQFKITGIDGSVVPPYYFNGTTAFTFIMPTWHTQLPLGDIGGSNSWLQNFITSQSNLWGGQTDKRN